MTQTRSIYREYVLSCRPMPLDDGTYQARVAIISAAGHQTRAQRFLDLEVFAQEEAAIERARKAGMDWVDKNIDRASFSPHRGAAASRF